MVGLIDENTDSCRHCRQSVLVAMHVTQLTCSLTDRARSEIFLGRDSPYEQAHAVGTPHARAGCSRIDILYIAAATPRHRLSVSFRHLICVPPLHGIRIWTRVMKSCPEVMMRLGPAGASLSDARLLRNGLWSVDCSAAGRREQARAGADTQACRATAATGACRAGTATAASRAGCRSASSRAGRSPPSRASH